MNPDTLFWAAIICAIFWLIAAGLGLLIGWNLLLIAGIVLAVCGVAAASLVNRRRKQ